MGRSSIGMDPFSSMVRYEMQRRASSMPADANAPVGQATRQRVHLPQFIGDWRLEIGDWRREFEGSAEFSSLNPEFPISNLESRISNFQPPSSSASSTAPRNR